MREPEWAGSPTPLEALETIASASRPNGRPFTRRRTRTWPTYRDCGVGSADASTTSRRSSPASGASARSRWPTTTTRSRASISREKIAAGPLEHLAVRRPAPGRARPRRSTSAPASRRSCAPTASPPSSASARCGSRTTRGTRRTRSRTASRRSRCRRRSSSASRSRPARRPATSRTRSPRTPRTPGCAASCSSPRTSSRARSSRRRSTAATSSRSTATTTT